MVHRRHAIRSGQEPRDVDARSGHYFDDTKRYVDAIDGLSERDRHKIYEGNALKIYPRLARKLAAATS